MTVPVSPPSVRNLQVSGQMESPRAFQDEGHGIRKKREEERKGGEKRKERERRGKRRRKRVLHFGIRQVYVVI